MYANVADICFAGELFYAEPVVYMTCEAQDPRERGDVMYEPGVTTLGTHPFVTRGS